MVLTSLVIYYSSARFRKDDFYKRLYSKSVSVAKLLFDAPKIDPQKVMEIEKDNPIKLHNEKIIVINYRNDTIYTTDTRGDIRIDNVTLERIRLYNTLAYKQDSYEVLGTVYLAKLDRFVIVAAATDIDGWLHLKKLRIILLFACLLSPVFLFIAGWIYSGKALQPISNIIASVENITVNNLNTRVDEGNGKDEISKLAGTFNNMLERLEKSFRIQKEFITNASHEMRTPLTSIYGQLEVLQMKKRRLKEYETVLPAVTRDIKKLINLINRLLLIARTSSENQINFKNKVRIDEIIWQSKEELLRFNNKFRINFSIDDSCTDSKQMEVAGDEYLLKIAVSNIIDNACKYSPDNQVDIILGNNGDFVEIKFIDKGIGIPEKELEKIFQPFFRGENIISIPGSGIGLRLVNQIVSNHKGKITINSTQGKGTTVNIILPLAR